MNTFIKYWKKIGMLALLTLLWVFFSITTDTFLTEATIMNILRQSSIIGILSCGVTMIIITGQTDISVGGRVAFMSVTAANMLVSGASLLAVIVVVLVLGVLTGAMNAVLSETLRTYIFVVSIATMNIWNGASLLITKGSMIYGFPDSMKAISQTRIPILFGVSVPSIVVIWVVCVLITGFILGKTRFGRQIYALGGNSEAAYLAGINIVKVNILVHALAGLFAGIGAIVLLSRAMSATATVGGSYAFDCIIACVLGGVLLGGGRGTVWQAALGVLVVNTLFNGLTILQVGDFWQMVVKGLIMLVAIGLEALQRRAKVDLSEDRELKAKELQQPEET